MQVTHDEIIRKEEKLKESVYQELEKMKSEAETSVSNAESVVGSDAYEDKAASMEYGSLNDAKKKKNKVQKLAEKLYISPYFAHIEGTFDSENGEAENFYLSDSEILEESISINDSGLLLPFKQNPERPISSALFKCYQGKKGEPVTYSSNNGNTNKIFPKLICNTEIRNRKLNEVNLLYPQLDDSKIQADDLLEIKLQENRENPTLRNIISTLQREQFEIIEIDTKKSFVLQGCAGSGKSQCLLHRLFFLRDALAGSGWSDVLLLTPTKLFRQYSYDLLGRYNLTGICNCSITDLYRELLNAYDSRFKERQYAFQMTEEYLPDRYLHDVYNSENVMKVEKEIENAIRKYVKTGCDALGMEEPKEITADIVEKIVNCLGIKMAEYDKIEKEHKEDKEYQNKRSSYEKILKDFETMKKKQQHYLDEENENNSRIQNLKKLADNLELAQKERDDWIQQRKNCIIDAKKKLESISQKVAQGTDIQAPAKYTRQLYNVKDLTEGKKYKEDEKYLSFLNDEYVAGAQRDLKEVIMDNTLNTVSARYEKRKNEISLNLTDIDDKMKNLENKIDETENWLRSIDTLTLEKKNKNTLIRSEMERAKFFLSRLESTVFEHEVWNVLSIVKEKYNIQILQIEELKGGKRKETRILYKADLLFYVKIYMKLHTNAKLPKYKLICIDEGQDLHSADYDILHKLYPAAAFNVFGDVGQVLHPECGISDWKSQTGISEVFSLTTNYRNTAVIVDFCNRKFGIKMQYIGSTDKSSEHIEITDAGSVKKMFFDNKTVLIVKDREKLHELCKKTGMNEKEFTYMDTLSEKTSNNRKECYSIYAAKGLEFKNVFVYAKGMTINQKVVACTRAMGGLKYYEE